MGCGLSATCPAGRVPYFPIFWELYIVFSVVRGHTWHQMFCSDDGAPSVCGFRQFCHSVYLLMWVLHQIYLPHACIRVLPVPPFDCGPGDTVSSLFVVFVTAAFCLVVFSPHKRKDRHDTDHDDKPKSGGEALDKGAVSRAEYRRIGCAVPSDGPGDAGKNISHEESDEDLLC